MEIKNAIVMATSSSCECDTWMLIMSKLKSVAGIHPRYFIYYGEEKFRKVKDQFLSQVGDEVYFHSEFENYKGRGRYKAKRSNVLGQSLLDKMASYESIALKMMDRFDPLSDSFPFTHRQWYFRELVLGWMDVIDELDLRIFISPDVPHRVSDYALYVACVLKNIEFIYFDLTPFGDASIINDSLDDYKVRGLFENDVYAEEKRRLVEDKLKEYRGNSEDYELDYMKDQQKRASRSLTERVYSLVLRVAKSPKVFRPIKRLFRDVFSFYVKDGEMPYTSKFNYLEKKIVDMKVSKVSRGYRDLYERLVRAVDLKNDKYVIFALHYQPEATTSPSGGVFVDQLLVIEMLDRLLPPDVKVLVKEHPSQFYGVLESASAGRSKVFYDSFSKFSERVIPVSLDLGSFALIDNSEAVVTITGTIGIESIARGKPVLCFGRTWYEGCQGVFRIRDADDLLSAWSEISGDGFAVAESEVDGFMHSISKDFVLAKHSGVYRKRSQRSQEETVQNVVNGIVLFLKRKSFI